MLTRVIITSLLLLPVLAAFAQAEQLPEDQWWPRQKKPSLLIIVDERSMIHLAGKDAEQERTIGAYRMLATSLAGLAAQAVNEDGFGEMLWIMPPGNASYDEWLRRLLVRTELASRKEDNPWAIARRFAEAGVVKGYILYRADESGLDESANAATTLAGLRKGILIEESLKEQADAAGLSMLADARNLTERQVFEQEQNTLNRHCAFLQKPDRYHGRDLAIAHRMMVLYGHEAPAKDLYAWLAPIATVYGWNIDPEDASVRPISEAGHVIVPCDWAPNLTALSIGAPPSLDGASVPRFQTPSPEPLAPDQSAMALMMSDGDNLQWILTSFAHSPRFWANARREEFPMTWGLPLGDLLQISPDAYSHLVETQGRRTSIATHLGYYYPDIFGQARGTTKRIALLKRMGRRAELVFRATGTSILTFLVIDAESPGTREACEILARESPSLRAILAVQYHPYEGARGRTLWFQQPGGSKVPLIFASYSLWQKAQAGERRLPPLKLSASILNRVKSAGTPFNEWTVVHAWSEFPEDVAGLPDANVGGVDPTFVFAKSLTGKIAVVPIEQVIARLLAERRD